MNWKEACSKSKYDKAVRSNQWYTFVRKNDGSAVAVNNSDNNTFEINEIKINGYIDWEPYNGEKSF